jgi:hypothetical protein
LQQDPAVVADTLTRARVALFERRSGRPRPHLDDKVLTAWNGLMIGAFARAGRVLSGGDALDQETSVDPGARHLASARRAAEFLRRAMWDKEQNLLKRRFRAGAAAIDGYAEDYACLIFGLLELFQSDADAAWLEWALALQRQQDRLFWDPNGGWFSTTGRDPSVLMRLKEDYDGAEPSASGVGAWNLTVLAHLTGDSAFASRAEEVFAAFGGRLSTQGRALPLMSSALSMARAQPEQIVVIGSIDSVETQALWRAVQHRYRPFATVLLVEPGERQRRLADHLPWTRDMTTRNGQPAAYVCRNFTCEAPVISPEELR